MHIGTYKCYNVWREGSYKNDGVLTMEYKMKTYVHFVKTKTVNLKYIKIVSHLCFLVN